MYQTCSMSAVMVALVLLARAAYAEEKPKDPTPLNPKVGQRFEETGVFLLAPTSMLFIEDFVKSVKADDREGLQEMVQNGTLLLIQKGDAVRVLEVKPKDDFLTPHGYAEVRVTRDGKSVGKGCVLLVHFTDKFFKVLEPDRE